MTITENGANAWIGGQAVDITDCKNDAGPFVWRPKSDIELPFFYTNWSKDQPDCSGGNEHCVHLWSDHSYKWNDAACSSLMYPLCEYDPFL